MHRSLTVITASLLMFKSFAWAAEQPMPHISVGLGVHEISIEGHQFIEGYFGDNENYDEMCEVWDVQIISEDKIMVTFVVLPLSSDYASCTYYLEFADGMGTITGTFRSPE